jgi:hypothetical protein
VKFPLKVLFVKRNHKYAIYILKLNLDFKKIITHV